VRPGGHRPCCRAIKPHNLWPPRGHLSQPPRAAPVRCPRSSPTWWHSTVEIMKHSRLIGSIRARRGFRVLAGLLAGAGIFIVIPVQAGAARAGVTAKPLVVVTASAWGAHVIVHVRIEDDGVASGTVTVSDVYRDSCLIKLAHSFGGCVLTASRPGTLALTATYSRVAGTKTSTGTVTLKLVSMQPTAPNFTVNNVVDGDGTASSGIPTACTTPSDPNGVPPYGALCISPAVWGSDADGNPVILAQAGLVTTAAGGTADFLPTGQIIYAPPSGSSPCAQADSFKYTVADMWGKANDPFFGSTATGTIIVEPACI
jgi:hypothetical protein